MLYGLEGISYTEHLAREAQRKFQREKKREQFNEEFSHIIEYAKMYPKDERLYKVFWGNAHSGLAYDKLFTNLNDVIEFVADLYPKGEFMVYDEYKDSLIFKHLND